MASQEEIGLQEALKRGSSDLKFILTRNDVSDELQAGFYRKPSSTRTQIQVYKLEHK